MITKKFLLFIIFLFCDVAFSVASDSVENETDEKMHVDNIVIFASSAALPAKKAKGSINPVRAKRKRPAKPFSARAKSLVIPIPLAPQFDDFDDGKAFKLPKLHKKITNENLNEIIMNTHASVLKRCFGGTTCTGVISLKRRLHNSFHRDKSNQRKRTGGVMSKKLSTGKKKLTDTQIKDITSYVKRLFSIRSFHDHQEE